MQTETAAAELAPDAALMPPPGERVGCGWFDSSYELHEGLIVTEDVDLCMFELWSASTLH